MARASIGILAAVLLVAACGDRQPSLMNIRNADRGPDEFGILPVKPLEEPNDYAALPAPTPGGQNLTDPSPEADAVVALGGRASALTRDGRVPGSALVSHVGRFGISEGIRDILAEEDLEYRRRNNGRLLERVFNVTVYFKAYKAQSLDQHAELERFRAAGIRTPAAPPEPEG